MKTNLIGIDQTHRRVVWCTDNARKIHSTDFDYIISNYNSLADEIEHAFGITGICRMGGCNYKFSVESWEAHQALMELAYAKHVETGYKYQFSLSKQLKGLEGKRVQVTLGPRTWRFTVGVTPHWIPFHLEHKRKGLVGIPAHRHYDSVEVI